MISQLEKEITFRYLKTRKKDGFLNIISIFSFIGISLGVAVLIIVMSVMNGFRSELINKIVGFNAHVTVKPYENAIDIKKLNNQDCKNFFIIGEATNLIMNEYYDGSIIKVAIDDIVKIDNQTLSIGAGLNWFKLIDYCLNHKFYGIENLTSIPGTVGAAPVQNIGAYGVEISSFVDSVTCYDFDTKQIQVMSNKECKFNYRESIFQLKNSLILRVNLKFSKEFSPILSYPSLSDYIVTNNINPSSITPKALSNLIKTKDRYSDKESKDELTSEEKRKYIRNKSSKDRKNLQKSPKSWI